MFELLISAPTLEDTWEFLAISSELFDLFSHVANLVFNLNPGNVSPLGHGVLDLLIEIVKFIEKLDLLFGVCELWIALMW